MKRTSTEWTHVLLACGVAAGVATAWGLVLSDEIGDSTFSKGDADIVDFLPEIIHESAYLTRLVENLNYSPDGLVRTFGAHRITPAQALRFGRIEGARPRPANQQAIANQIYGGEWGRVNLGNLHQGDGWRFRGRGVIQITGRANYARVGDLMGQDLTVTPELLEQPRFALEACIHWWEDRIPDSMLGDTSWLRARVNGGTLGLAEVRRLTAIVRRQLEVEA